MAISLLSYLPANKKQHYSNIEPFKQINYFESEIKHSVKKDILRSKRIAYMFFVLVKYVSYRKRDLIS